MCILAKFAIFFVVLIFGLAGVATAAPTPHKGEATWYNPSDGIGACGRSNGTQKDSELVGAIAARRYDQMTPDGNPNHSKACGKKATVKRGSKSVTVTIVDRCQACGYNDIDLSPTAFKRLAALSEGRVAASWSGL
ncbi:hypothetical protein FRC12_007634 [Ceratobasidium sp. 428]|nr:hypothetical protein FRC12_007634 [Ceratobasidium sp. 428]